MEMDKLYNEDCRKGMMNIVDNSIDLIITDPPYKTTSRGQAGNSGGMLQKDINKKGQVFKHNNAPIETWIDDLYRVLKDGGHCYIMTNHTNLKKYLNVAENAGFSFIKSLIWDKGNKIMGQYYMSQFEYILFFRKGKGVKINNCGTSDIIRIPNDKTKDSKGNNLHDTEKPVALSDILIKNSSKEGDTVLDPFVGVGWVAISAKKLNRDFICYEIDKEPYEKAKRRLKNIKTSLI